MIHHTLSYEVHNSRIVQRILDSLRMATSVCYLVTLALVYLSFVVLTAVGVNYPGYCGYRLRPKTPRYDWFPTAAYD
jgi:hypothetical protein